MRLLHILGRPPIGLFCNRPPGIKLCPSGLQAFASFVAGKVGLRQVRTYNYHWTRILLNNSIKWNLEFHFWESKLRTVKLGVNMIRHEQVVDLLVQSLRL